MEYVATIGLECHAQLRTRTKMFCGCPVTHDAPPNSAVCPICLGHPGTLPRLNAEAVVLGVRAGLALGCTVHDESVFSRKHYFYPDLPKGYQISQYDRPLCTGGQVHVEIDGQRRAYELIRIHLEEDAGRMHHTASGSSVDWNRGGVPLVEIVGAPDLHSPEEAESWLRALHRVLVSAGLCTGDMEKGHFRCDANVSVAPAGGPPGTRVEIKNVNSFRHVHRAIEHETARLIELAEAGETFKQHTRQWDDESGRTVFLREKEGSDDYRYFPDPDLPPLVLDRPWVDELRGSIPELPEARRQRFVRELKLPAYDAEVLTGHPKIGDFFESILGARPGDAAWAKRAANFVMTEVLADAKVHGLLADFPVSGAQIVELLKLVDAQTISGKQAKEVYAAIKGTSQSPEAFVREKGMAQVSDEGALEAICRAQIAANPKQAAAYKAGKKGMIGFFVGAVMKETKGSANPALLNQILDKLLME